MIVTISAMKRVSKVSLAALASKREFELIVITNPRPEGDELEVQEASVKIVIKGE